MAGIEWTQEEESTLKQNYPWYDKEVMNLLPRRSWDAIKLKAAKLGLQYDHPCTAKTTGRLLEETPEAYYWNGFLLADGTFQEQGTIGLFLGLEDVKQVRRFGSFIGKDKINNRSEIGRGIIVQSRKVSKPLMEKFNYKRNKTKDPPINWGYKSVPTDLLVAHLIGFIDGDGSIIRQHKRRLERYRIHLRIDACWVEWLKGYIEEVRKRTQFSFGTPYLGYDQRTECCIGSHKTVVFLRNFAKQHRLPVLERKWSKVND